MVRPQAVPASLIAENPKYNTDDVLKSLKEMCHNKCYICEVSDPLSVAVEHFDAEGDRHDWNNLFLACHRCNSNIKLNKYNNLLNPCDDNIDVVKAIAHDIPKSPNSKIHIRAQDQSPPTVETAELLDKVFNNDDTANRKITRKYIRKKVFAVASKFLKEITTYSDPDTPPQKKQEAFEQIEHFLRDEQEFSVFLRWVILDDDDLSLAFQNHIN